MTMKEILAVRATPGHARWYPGKQHEIEAGTAQQGWGQYLTAAGRPTDELTAGGQSPTVDRVDQVTAITGGTGGMSSSFGFGSIPSVVWIILAIAGGIYLMRRI